MKRIALAVALLVSLAAPAWAGYNEGRAAYIAGDCETALREYRTAAQQGDAESQNALGVYYNNGMCVEQDRVEAMRWLQKAFEGFTRLANQGNAKAQRYMCVYYKEGRSVSQDYGEAARWCRLAAVQGEYWAQVNLAIMYEKGQGVTKDHVLAHMWYNISGLPYSRDRVAKQMTSAQIAEAQKLAREWKPKKE